MTERERILLLYQAGNIERCHLIPHLRSYTNAQHQYYCSLLLLELYPKQLSFNLLAAILTHDLGELWTSDISRSMKWYYPNFKKLVHKIEKEIDEQFGFGESKYPLTEYEKSWLKDIDILELWLWSNFEIDGWNNRHAIEVYNNIENNWKPINKEVQNFIEEFKIFGWSRINPREIKDRLNEENK